MASLITTGADMKDWPMTLKRNAAICELAVAIFKARGECYGGSTVLTDQPTTVRSQYVTRADELLKTLTPGRVIVSGLFPTRAPLAGVIAPSTGDIA